MTSSRKWPTSIWLLVVALVILAQYIISGWVASYGHDPAVVSHVGFAGTIISIILAVLAIVYSFFQTFSQQRESDTIATQIELLRQTANDIVASRADLASEVERFSELGVKLDRSLSLGESSWKAVQGIDSKIDEIKQRSITESATASESADTTQGGEVETVAARLIRRASNLQLALYFALYRASQERLSPEDAGVILVGQGYLQGTKYPALREWLDGIFVGVWQLLHDLGMMGFDSTDRVVMLNSEFEKELLIATATPRPAEPEPLITVDSIRAANVPPRTT